MCMFLLLLRVKIHKEAMQRAQVITDSGNWLKTSKNDDGHYATTIRTKIGNPAPVRRCSAQLAGQGMISFLLDLFGKRKGRGGKSRRVTADVD